MTFEITVRSLDALERLRGRNNPPGLISVCRTDPSRRRGGCHTHHLNARIARIFALSEIQKLPARDWGRMKETRLLALNGNFRGKWEDKSIARRISEIPPTAGNPAGERGVSGPRSGPSQISSHGRMSQDKEFL